MKLKRAVIREEFVILTGDWVSAIVLSQFLFWLERRLDFDQFIVEEKKRNPNTIIEPTKGWIFKSCQQLEEELMGIVSAKTIRRRLQGHDTTRIALTQNLRTQERGGGMVQPRQNGRGSVYHTLLSYK